MRLSTRFRLTLGACLLVSLAASAPASRSQAAAPPFGYVALGDSFSAGEGIRPYLAGSRCDRSSRAYATWVRPPGLAASVYALASGGGAPGPGHTYGSRRNARSSGGFAWALWACSGARTVNVLPRSLRGVGQGAGRATRPQLDSADLAGADLVTLTIGGNDAGYADVLVACGLFACNTTDFAQRQAARIDAMRPLLVETYRAIAAKAPRARILVLGYPQAFPASRAEQSCPMLTAFAGEQDMLRALGVRLNATIAAAVASVARTGADVVFVPVAARFAGHEICGRKGAWLNGIVRSPNGLGLDPGSFHPNLDGQRDGYAAAVDAALR